MSLRTETLATPVTVTRNTRDLVGAYIRRNVGEDVITIKLEWIEPQADGSLHTVSYTVDPAAINPLRREIEIIIASLVALPTL